MKMEKIRLMKNKIKQLFDSALEQNYFDFKQIFNEIFVEELNNVCEKEAKEVTKVLARFDVVEETISVPLKNNDDVEDAHLFAIESDDEDNMVLKFKVGEESKSFKVKKEDEDFYKELKANGFDKADEKAKEKIAMDLNEFMADVEVDKKDESIERGDELKSPKVKMEAVDMSKLTGDARLQALKKLAEKKKLEASKKMQEENDEEDEDEVKMEYEVDLDKPLFRIVGKHPDGKPFKSPKANDKSMLSEKVKELEKKGFKSLKIEKANIDEK